MSPSVSEPPFANTRPSVRINGREDSRFGDAVMSIVVEMPSDGMDGVEVRLQNWSVGEGGNTGATFDDVQLGDELTVVMGGGAGDVVFDGHVTAIEERYGEGAPQLILLGEDRLHLLSRLRASRVMEDVSVDDLVAQVAEEVGLSSDVRVSTDVATWHQLNESHLAFLRRVLFPYGATLRVTDGTQLVVCRHEPAAQPVAVDAADNAINVRIVADLNRQYSRVTARGFDLASGERVHHEASKISGAPQGVTATSALGDVGWTAEADVPTPFVSRQVDAEVAAQGALDTAASRFLHGHMTCEGDARFRPAGEVELAGVSDRLAGIYAIDHCVHHFNAEDGYRTQLAVSRPEWQP